MNYNFLNKDDGIIIHYENILFINDVTRTLGYQTITGEYFVDIRT